jgi:hypothetical protein
MTEPFEISSWDGAGAPACAANYSAIAMEANPQRPLKTIMDVATFIPVGRSHDGTTFDFIISPQQQELTTTTTASTNPFIERILFLYTIIKILQDILINVMKFYDCPLLKENLQLFQKVRQRGDLLCNHP